MDLSKKLAENSFLLLNFSAAWCEPCQWAEPILKEVVTKMDGKLALQKIDIDQEPQLSHDYHIKSVPTLVLMKNSKEVWRMRGFDTAPNLVRAFSEFVVGSA